jgi:hypothetical protein
MMGFGGMGMTVPWLVGVITLAAIWAGVWWMLTAIGINPRPRGHRPPPSLPERPGSPTWQQPDFRTDPASPPAAAQPNPQVHLTHPESDFR